MSTAYSRLDISSDYPIMQKSVLYILALSGMFLPKLYGIYDVQGSASWIHNLFLILMSAVLLFIIQPLFWKAAGAFRRFASPSGFRHKADYSTAFNQKIRWTFGPYIVASGLAAAMAGAPVYFWAKNAQGVSIYQQSHEANSPNSDAGSYPYGQAANENNQTNSQDLGSATPPTSEPTISLNGNASGSAETQAVNAQDQSNSLDIATAAAPAHQTQVFRPSFECRKLLSSVEKIICSDAQLSQQDVDLSQIFNTLRSTLSGSALTDLKNDEKLWMIQRTKCDSVDCLENMYNNRINSLRNYTDIDR